MTDTSTKAVERLIALIPGWLHNYPYVAEVKLREGIRALAAERDRYREALSFAQMAIIYAREAAEFQRPNEVLMHLTHFEEKMHAAITDGEEKDQ